jgi:hypothetical protein
VGTKLQKIAKDMANELGKFSENYQESDAYTFETGAYELITKFSNQLFQGMVGEIPKGENSKVKIATTLGEIVVKKGHPMSTRPMGFQISPRLQEHACRIGSRLVFSEASEELKELSGITMSDKQIERMCHTYGGKLDEIDWQEAYSDSVQTKIPHDKKENVYAMVDGSMILTREEKWKEIKLGRIFTEGSQVAISKERNILTSSIYTAHIGNAADFWERFSKELPPVDNIVFISDGARWIWNYISERYPNSTQILDLYHCKEHIYGFANEFFTEKQHAKQFAESICELLTTGTVDGALNKIRHLPADGNKKQSKEKLLTYLENNKTRIDYRKYIEQGLLVGSGAIESAHREIIQKRMKLSGQRWTIKGAQQIANLRVFKKSGRWDILMNYINNQSLTLKKAA